MLRLDMTQGKSQIVSGTNVVSKSDEIEPTFWFFLQKMRYFGQLPNFTMLYLLNCWADSVQPVGLDCWNTVFFIPGSFIMCFLVICRLFACNCWGGVNFWPFWANFFGFLGTPSQNGPILRLDMTQGKSKIVSGTNVVSKGDVIEQIFWFFF